MATDYCESAKSAHVSCAEPLIVRSGVFKLQTFRYEQCFLQDGLFSDSQESHLQGTKRSNMSSVVKQ